MISSLSFFLSESKYIELELALEGQQGAHEVEGHALGERGAGGAPTLVERVWALWSSYLARIFYCFFYDLPWNFKSLQEYLFSAHNTTSW